MIPRNHERETPHPLGVGLFAGTLLGALAVFGLGTVVPPKYALLAIYLMCFAAFHGLGLAPLRKE